LASRMANFIASWLRIHNPNTTFLPFVAQNGFSLWWPLFLAWHSYVITVSGSWRWFHATSSPN
jgi:hypothetical protein